MSCVHLVFVTVGTSIVDLRDFFPRPGRGSRGFDPSVPRNWSAQDMSDAARDYVCVHGDRIAKELSNRTAALDKSVPADLPSVPAEISSTWALRRLADASYSDPQSTELILLASTRFPGPNAADWVAHAAKEVWGYQCTVKQVEGLDMVDPIGFKKFGLLGLGNAVVEALQSRQPGSGAPELTFNITGGYKGSIPFLQMIAISSGATVFYQFKESYEGVRFPRFRIELPEPVSSVQSPFDRFLRQLRTVYELSRGDGACATGPRIES